MADRYWLANLYQADPTVTIREVDAVSFEAAEERDTDFAFVEQDDTLTVGVSSDANWERVVDVVLGVLQETGVVTTDTLLFINRGDTQLFEGTVMDFTNRGQVGE